MSQLRFEEDDGVPEKIIERSEDSDSLVEDLISSNGSYSNEEKTPSKK